MIFEYLQICNKIPFKYYLYILEVMMRSLEKQKKNNIIEQSPTEQYMAFKMKQIQKTKIKQKQQKNNNIIHLLDTQKSKQILKRSSFQVFKNSSSNFMDITPTPRKQRNIEQNSYIKGIYNLTKQLLSITDQMVPLKQQHEQKQTIFKQYYQCKDKMLKYLENINDLEIKIYIGTNIQSSKSKIEVKQQNNKFILENLRSKNFKLEQEYNFYQKRISELEKTVQIVKVQNEQRVEALMVERQNLLKQIKIIQEKKERKNSVETRQRQNSKELKDQFSKNQKQKFNKQQLMVKAEETFQPFKYQPFYTQNCDLKRQTRAKQLSLSQLENTYQQKLSIRQTNIKQLEVKIKQTKLENQKNIFQLEKKIYNLEKANSSQLSLIQINKKDKQLLENIHQQTKENLTLTQSKVSQYHKFFSLMILVFQLLQKHINLQNKKKLQIKQQFTIDKKALYEKIRQIKQINQEKLSLEFFLKKIQSQHKQFASCQKCKIIEESVKKILTNQMINLNKLVSDKQFLLLKIIDQNTFAIDKIKKDIAQKNVNSDIMIKKMKQMLKWQRKFKEIIMKQSQDKIKLHQIKQSQLQTTNSKILRQKQALVDKIKCLEKEKIKNQHQYEVLIKVKDQRIFNLEGEIMSHQLFQGTLVQQKHPIALVQQEQFFYNAKVGSDRILNHHDKEISVQNQRLKNLERQYDILSVKYSQLGKVLQSKDQLLNECEQTINNYKQYSKAFQNQIKLLRLQNGKCMQTLDNLKEKEKLLLETIKQKDQTILKFQIQITKRQSMQSSQHRSGKGQELKKFKKNLNNIVIDTERKINALKEQITQRQILNKQITNQIQELTRTIGQGHKREDVFDNLKVIKQYLIKAQQNNKKSQNKVEEKQQKQDLLKNQKKESQSSSKKQYQKMINSFILSILDKKNNDQLENLRLSKVKSNTQQISLQIQSNNQLSQSKSSRDVHQQYQNDIALGLKSHQKSQLTHLQFYSPYSVKSSRRSSQIEPIEEQQSEGGSSNSPSMKQSQITYRLKKSNNKDDYKIVVKDTDNVDKKGTTYQY